MQNKAMWYVFSSWVNKFHLANECKNITEIYHCWLPNSKRCRSIENPSVFDHINLENAYIMISADRYPTVDYHLSFPKKKFCRAYSDAAMFGVKFVGMDELITLQATTKYYILFSYSVFDIQIKAKFTENVPANTKAYAVVISDKMLSFQSDGNKMSVIY